MYKRHSLLALAVCMAAAGDAGADAGSGSKSDPKPAATVRCRVLVDGAFGKPNDVVEVDAKLAEKNKHELDSDPGACVQADKERVLFERRQRLWRGEVEQIE